jgi:hypothetical protein
MIMLSKETGFINLRQSLLLADDGTAAGMNMNGVYKLSDTTMDGFAFSATYRWSTAAISSSISLSILPNQLDFIAQLDSGININDEDRTNDSARIVHSSCL